MSITPDRLYALPPDDSGAWVYLHYAADGTVLYVGYSERSVRARQTNHKRAAWWPEVAMLDVVGPFDTVHEARVAERDLIREHQPVGNTVGTASWKPGRARRDPLVAARDRVERLRRELAGAEHNLARLEREARQVSA